MVAMAFVGTRLAWPVNIWFIRFVPSRIRCALSRLRFSSSQSPTNPTDRNGINVWFTSYVDRSAIFHLLSCFLTYITFAIDPFFRSQEASGRHGEAPRILIDWPDTRLSYSCSALLEPRHSLVTFRKHVSMCLSREMENFREPPISFTLSCDSSLQGLKLGWPETQNLQTLCLTILIS